jgi:outer membrane biosynthesis protein TonB
MMSGSWLLELGSRMAFAALLLGVAAMAGACAKAQARTSPDGAVLNMPVPPERVIVAMEDPAPAAVVEEPAPTAPPVATKPAPASPPRPAVRPEPKPEPPAPVVADPKPAEPRTLKPADVAVSERSIRERLRTASRDLGRIDYRKLSSPRRTQYEQSKRFVEQAEQAIREQNLVFAATLADKAAALAAELVGR